MKQMHAITEREANRNEGLSSEHYPLETTTSWLNPKRDVKWKFGIIYLTASVQMQNP